MENQPTEQSLFELSITENVKTQLKGAVGWGGMAALVSLAGAILTVIDSFLPQKTMVRTYDIEGLESSAGSGSSIFSAFIGLALSILLFVFLSKFNKLTKSGLASNSSDTISEGLGGLASYFITIGVLIILVLVLVLLLIAGVAAGGAR